MGTFSGFLLASPSGSVLTRELLTISAQGSQSPQLNYRGPFQRLKRWEEFTLLSRKALADEDPEIQKPPYRYRILCVRRGTKLVVLAERRRIAEYVIVQLLNRSIFPNLRKVAIRVDRLIESCQDRTSEFLITSLYGRFSGADTQLRTMLLYGDDVTESAVYREHKELFNFSSCGIGRRLFDDLPRVSSSEDREIVRVGNDVYFLIKISAFQLFPDIA